MNFIKFIVWLASGAIIGLFASRMVENERSRSSKVKITTIDGDV